ncbi:MAG TPA: hypothetical protein VHU87_08760 [Rhizomicrobium sp.]|jgi:hypothetical protein|nr:hypothetical protein [Rhizomicrobium sp.]
MRILAVILTVTLAVPAMAGGAKAPEPGTSVEMPYLIAPIIVDDRLVSYAYVSCKIVGVSPQAAIDIRLATPFIQDAFVRDVNAASIGTAADPSVVDQPALAARLLADAKRIAGAAKVSDLKLIQVQIAQMRPSP